jgi:hypothetical protein
MRLRVLGLLLMRFFILLLGGSEGLADGLSGHVFDQTEVLDDELVLIFQLGAV